MFRTVWICVWLLLAATAAGARSYRPDQVPHVQRADRNRYVSNPDDILSAEAVAHIDSVCAGLRAQGLAQVAVVALDAIAGGDAFDFAVELFRSWGVGDARNDNGLGILLVKEQREIRFVTGGGLEGVLPDAICKRIQLYRMLPAFRSNDYSAGMVAGIDAVATVLTEGGEALPEEPDDAVPLGEILTILAVVFGFPAAVVGIILYRQNRCPKCHKRKLEQVQRLEVADRPGYREVLYTFRCTACGHELTRRVREHKQDDDSMLGDGFGPMPGGGMFGRGGRMGGGFGGGSFGGGGAGSRW